jgi:hypothetical protein
MPKRSRRREPTIAERRASRPKEIDPNQLYSISETCAAIDVSRPQFYRLVAQKRLKLLDPPLDSRPRIAGSEILRLIGAATPQAA